MFTGLVQAVGSVAEVRGTRTGNRLVVDVGAWMHRPAEGDSISVSGVCLTVAGLDGPRAAFDVVPETLGKTTLGRLKSGDRVNLEHCVTPTTLMGGHFVQGHVDGIGAVRAIASEGEWRVTLAIPADLMPYIAPKGSIALDGVSLTVADIDAAGRSIDVALIPTTLDRTTLGAWKVGSVVNVEADMLAKSVVHYIRQFTHR